MPGLPVLHSTNNAPVAVLFETDLASFGDIVRTFQEGTVIWCRETQALYTWDPQSTAATIPSESVAVPGGGAFIVVGSAAMGFNPLNVRQFGATGNGVTDDTLAIQNAIDTANAIIDSGASPGCVVWFPRGIYKVVAGLTVPENRIHLVGDGLWSPEILFTPTVAGTICITIQKGATEIFQNSIRNLAILAGNTIRKIGVRAVDTSELVIENFAVQGFGTAGWATVADSSIALQLRGREFTRIESCSLHADRPISIETNPNNGIASDQLWIRECDLNAVTGVGSKDILVFVDSTIPGTDTVTNLNVINCNGEGGKGFFQYLGGAVATAGANINIDDCRWEQPALSTGFAIEVDRTLVNFTIDNFGCGASAKGAKFSAQVSNLTLSNVTYEGADVGFDFGGPVAVKNVFATNAAATVNGQQFISGQWTFGGNVFEQRRATSNGSKWTSPDFMFRDTTPTDQLKISYAANQVILAVQPTAGDLQLKAGTASGKVSLFGSNAQLLDVALNGSYVDITSAQSSGILIRATAANGEAELRANGSGNSYVNGTIVFLRKTNGTQAYELRTQGGQTIVFDQSSGSPEGVITAGPASLCFDYTNGELYIKNSGVGNTGWKKIVHL